MLAITILAALLAAANPADDIQGTFTAVHVRPHLETSRITVQGWAVSRCGAPELTLYVDEQEIARAKPWMTDASVLARYPASWGAELPAFRTEVDPLVYDPGPHRIHITARAGECGERSLGSQPFVTIGAVPEWLAWPILLGALGLAWGLALLLHRLPRKTQRVPLAIGVGLLLLTSLAAILLGLPSVGITDHPPFAALANWDAKFYLSIATQGYAAAGEVAYGFFPLYPLLLRALDPLPGPVELPAALVNALLFAASIRMLRRLLPDGDSGLLAYAALPYAFFFVALYTESLALFLCVSFVTLLRAKRGFLAFCAGFLAGLTRLPCLALVFFAADDIRARRRTGFAALGPFAGASAFALFLWQTTGDPLKYAHAQQSFSRSNEFSAGRILQTITRVWTTSDQWGLVDVTALVIVIVGACLLVRAGRWPEGLYSAAVVLLPLASMSVMSIHRYALLAFPVFPLLAGYFRNRFLYWALIATEVVFLVIYGLHFGRQNFVG